MNANYSIMGGTETESSDTASECRPWQSGLRILLAAAMVCAIPSWFIFMSVKEEMHHAPLRAQGVHVDLPPSPDVPTGFVAIVLQCAGLMIYRVSRDRKPLLVYLLAVPVPVFLGLLTTWTELRHLDVMGLLSPLEIAELRSEAWSHTYFGWAASLLVLLITICGLTWKKPQSCMQGRREGFTPLAVEPRPFQFTLRAALIVMTTFAIGLSAASYCEQPVWVACMFSMIGTSVLTITYGGDYGCGLSVILLGLCFGGLCAAGPHRPHPLELIGFSLSLMLIAVDWRTMRTKGNLRSEEDAPK